MKTINRESKEVLLGGGRAGQRFYILVEEYRIYFTAAITRFCELQEGLYVHFLNDGAIWNFYVNDDPEGFKLTPVRSKGGFHVSNTGLTRMILKSMGYGNEKTKRLMVEKTDRQHDKCIVYDLSTENISKAIR